MENKTRCFSCGKFDKKFWIIMFIEIILTGVSYVVLYIISKNANEAKEKEESGVDIISHFFLGYFTQFLMIIPHLILKKDMSSKKGDQRIEKSNISIEYIFNTETIEFSTKEIIFFFGAGIIKLLSDIILIIFLTSFSNKDKYNESFSLYYYFELIFLFLFSKIMYGIQLYKHQYFSVIILTLSALGKFIYLNYEMDVEPFIWYLLFHILGSILKSVFNVYIKGLMEYKYYSPYKVCYVYGLINLIIITVIYVIFSCIPCDNSNTECNIIYNDKRYYANILSLFNITGLFILFFEILLSALAVLNYIVIYRFTVFHIFLFLQFSQILDIAKYSEKEEQNIYNIIIIISFIIFNIFFVLLFLEVIEINIFKISFNTKKNIENRALLERELSTVCDEDNNEEEVEE